ncbi:MAG: hypothetical protein ACP5G1_03075 [Nanopusillaceae archaeon]
MYKKLNPYEILLIESENAEENSFKLKKFLKSLYNILTLANVRSKIARSISNFSILVQEKETYEILRILLSEYPLEAIGAFVITLTIVFSPEIMTYVMNQKVPSLLSKINNVKTSVVVNNYVKAGIKGSTLIASVVIANKLIHELTTEKSIKTIKNYGDVASLYQDLLRAARKRLEEAQKVVDEKPKTSLNLFESFEDDLKNYKEKADKFVNDPRVGQVSKVLYTVAWVLTVFALGFALFASFINNNYKVTLKTVAVLSALGFSRVI